MFSVLIGVILLVGVAVVTEAVSKEVMRTRCWGHLLVGGCGLGSHHQEDCCFDGVCFVGILDVLSHTYITVVLGGCIGVSEVLVFLNILCAHSLSVH